MKKQSVYHKNTELRKEHLINSSSEYRLFRTGICIPVGSIYSVDSKRGNRPSYESINGLLNYTFDEGNEYGKSLNEGYGRKVDNLKAYSIKNVNPSYKVNDYEGKDDYREYIGEVYGKEESYLGYLSNLAGVRQMVEKLAYDIFPDAEGKTFADYINEIRQFGDVKYAMEKDSVGIVKNVRVAEALGGVITTNINNYSGKDTRLGMLSNLFYAQSLLRGAEFNSMRKTKYITEGLDRIYGNNLSNVHNLSSIFTPDSTTGRFADITDESFMGYMGQPIDEYLSYFINDFQLPDTSDVWNKGYSYFEPYYGYKKGESGWNSDIPQISTNAYEYYSVKEGNTDEGKSVSKGVQVKNISSEKLEVNKGENLLNKTNTLFKEKKIKTMIGEYYVGDNEDKTPSLIQSAVTERFGISRGRNLLTKDAWLNGSASQVGGYPNPYCRSWTYHNQYSKMIDLIRPFKDNKTFIDIDELQKEWGIFRPYKGEWGKYSVINKNGMVNITPTENSPDDIKRCMFSIENLAWKNYGWQDKDENKGHNSGRIMWFPPYDIKFQENVNVNWNKTEFIGRGEPVYTYTNTQRSGTLSFTLLVDHPAILDYWMLNKRNNANEDDEQTALRFFAGCETIKPAAETIDALNKLGNGGSLNFKDKAITEDDIIFYVFYPYGYDGEDFDKIFGGSGDGMLKIITVSEEYKKSIEEDIKELNNADGSQSDELGSIKEDKEKLLTSLNDLKLPMPFLGYEMLNSPISTKFEIIGEPINDLSKELFLYKIIDEKTFNENKEDDNGTVVITWDNFIKKYEEDDLSKYYTYDIIQQYNASNSKNEKNEEREGEIQKEKEVIKSEINKLTGLSIDGNDDITDQNNWGRESELGKLNGQYVTEKDKQKKKELKEKIEGFKRVLTTKKKQYEDLDKEEKQLTENKNNNKINSLVEEVEKLFGKQTQRFIKTTCLYFSFIDGKLTKEEKASDAYIKYMVKNLDNQYKNLEEAEKKFYNDYVDVNICYCKDDKKYYKIVVNDSSDSIASQINVFKSKSEFKKSDDRIGLCKGKYLIKSDDEIIEVDTFDELKNGLRDYKDENEFLNSNEKLGKVNSKLKIKSLETIDENAVKEIITGTLPKNNSNEIDEDAVKETYFAGSLYQSYEDLDKMVQKKDKNLKYGYVQYFAEMKSDYPIYDSIQDFVIDSQLKLNYIHGVNVEYEVNKIGIVKHEDVYYKIRALLSYNEEDTVCQYPTSASDLKGINTIVNESMGLNSTYEVVKEYMKDDKISCSFGEYYAALNGNDLTDNNGTLEVDDTDKITQFVLKCEWSVLKNSGKFKEEEIDSKIEEAKVRINRVKKVIKGQGQDDEVKGIKITSSKEESNMISTRDTNIETFIKQNNLNNKNSKKTDFEGEGSAQDIKENETVTSKRKGRNTKAQIVLGLFDDIKGDRDGEFDEFDNIKNEGEITKSYGKEYLFFSMLEESDEIAHKQLVDKVKYFSPAYHSMTPEGFNSRLTFLHQCTRQGKLNANGVANNISFGPPPVCVLRLGDFLNTKIVITGLSISYPDSKWDFNQEGIGMQFMMAEVQMNIDIIGGSDLKGPINKLQNAMSFNYYANTSVYNAESERNEG